MDGQSIAAILLVTAAATYVMRTLWRSIKLKGSGCGSSCGKCSAAEPKSRRAGMISLEMVNRPHAEG